MLLYFKTKRVYTNWNAYSKSKLASTSNLDFKPYYGRCIAVSCRHASSRLMYM